MVESKAKNVKKVEFFPENCTRCYLCSMICSLRYQGVVSNEKAFTEITGRDEATKIKLTKGCTFCGDCFEVCYYNARKITFKDEEGDQ